MSSGGAPILSASNAGISSVFTAASNAASPPATRAISAQRMVVSASESCCAITIGLVNFTATSIPSSISGDGTPSGPAGWTAANSGNCPASAIRYATARRMGRPTSSI